MLGTRSPRRRDRRPARSRRGFTLLELVAALALSGLVAAGVWRLVSQLGDVQDRARAEQSAFAARVNGERLVLSVVARAESGPRPDGQFTGDATGASFLTWCLTPWGWLERCRVALAVIGSSDGSAVVLRAGRDDVVVVRGRGAATFLYYDARQSARPWSAAWTSDVALPDAVGIAFGKPEADTLLFPIGAR